MFGVNDDLRWKVSWNGREWQTRSEVDAGVLCETLVRSWPDNPPPEVWERVAAGGYDPIAGVNFDGWAWRKVEWRDGRFERVESPEP
jgi:hypothetical protein